MSPLLRVLIFGIALALTIFFFGTLVAWCVYSIAPKSFKHPFKSVQQHVATWCMFIAIVVNTLLPKFIIY